MSVKYSSCVMDPIDESRRKPRRTRGTPSYYYRNRVALSVLGVAITTFALFSSTPIFRKFNNNLLKPRYQREDVERTDLLMMFNASRSSKNIRQELEEQND